MPRSTYMQILKHLWPDILNAEQH